MFIMFIAFIAIPTVVYLGIKHYRFKQLSQETVDGFMKLVWNSERYKLPGVIRHRGSSIEIPENTLEGIQQAKKDGCCGVEIDLDFTKDGVGVLLHDSTVDRTTDGTGELKHITLTELQQLNAAAKHKNSKILGHIKIPTLEESLDLCLKLDLMIFIDCKGDTQKTADLLCRLYKENPKLYKSAIVCSFFPQIIYTVRKQDLAILTALTYRPRFISSDGYGEPRFKGLKQSVAYATDYIGDFAHATILWYYLGNSFYLLSKDCISRKVFNKWKNRNIHLIAWTVDKHEEKNYLLKYLECPIIAE